MLATDEYMEQNGVEFLETWDDDIEEEVAFELDDTQYITHGSVQDKAYLAYYKERMEHWKQFPYKNEEEKTHAEKQVEKYRNLSTPQPNP